ncbi:MAG: SGNH/GDSL hydrolase family protein, partial [bacterium]|nr:SGNH/GDSL hydrolase family protein [bacterium]
QITSRLKNTGAKLVWVTTTPVPDSVNEQTKGSIDRLNKIANTLMKEQNIPILDLNRAITPRLDEYQLPEDCHFNEKGYEFMGNLMAETVLDELR